MKKVLLTTSALTLLAGAAAAGVSLSGYGRIGVTYNGGTGVSATYSRFRLNITGTTQTDGGLTFGAWVRINSTQTTLSASGGTA
ncbi:MAG: porin, partial [Paracoccaceae bacterium]